MMDALTPKHRDRVRVVSQRVKMLADHLTVALVGNATGTEECEHDDAEGEQDDDDEGDCHAASAYPAGWLASGREIVEERIAQLEAKEWAQAIVIRGLVAQLFYFDPDGLTRLRESACNTLESAYGVEFSHDGAHLLLQTAIHYVEQALAPLEPSGRG